MAILKIIKDGDETLRRHSRPVTQITPRIITLLDDMTDTMRAANGCGLAAVQVGVLRRVVVIEVEEGKVIELINPKVVEERGHQEECEGCLSIPGRWGITSRPAWCRVEAVDRNGKPFSVEGDGLLCRALCHETDHLDGKLFTDVMIREIEDDEE